MYTRFYLSKQQKSYLFAYSNGSYPVFYDLKEKNNQKKDEMFCKMENLLYLCSRNVLYSFCEAFFVLLEY